MTVNKKRLGVKRLRAIWDATTGVYKHARDTYLDELFPGKVWADEGLGLFEDEERNKEFFSKSDPAIFEEIDRRYQAGLCKLPSDVLEDIIKAANCGAQRRAPRTLEGILDELTRRGIMGDSQEIS